MAAVRLLWAALLLGWPSRLIRSSGGEDSQRSRVVARVLGARHAAQGALELAGGLREHRGRPGPASKRWLVAGAGVDVLHAASGVGLAAFDRRWRRTALSDALATTGLAAWGAAIAGAAPR